MPDDVEPVLPRSLCGVLLAMSDYFAEHPDQRVRVLGAIGAWTVEAVRVADGGDVATAPVVISWSVPFAWFPVVTLPGHLQGYLNFVALADTLTVLRDETSPFSVYVRKCFEASVPNPFDAFASVLPPVSETAPAPAPKVEKRFDFRRMFEAASAGDGS